MGAAAPTNWAICDGTNGTPDMRGLLPIGVSDSYALDSTGGSADAIAVSHNHTASTNNTGAHTHSTNSAGNHTHTVAGAASSSKREGPGSPVPIATAGTKTTSTAGNHSHTANSNGNHTHTVTVTAAGSSGTGKNLPPYRVVNYIMRIS